MTNPLRDNWACYFKVRFIGTYWKIAWVLNFAALMGVKIEYFCAGTIAEKVAKDVGNK
jgi:hypothetical protein